MKGKWEDSHQSLQVITTKVRKTDTIFAWKAPQVANFREFETCISSLLCPCSSLPAPATSPTWNWGAGTDGFSPDWSMAILIFKMFLLGCGIRPWLTVQWEFLLESASEPWAPLQGKREGSKKWWRRFQDHTRVSKCSVHHNHHHQTCTASSTNTLTTSTTGIPVPTSVLDHKMLYLALQAPLLSFNSTHPCRAPGDQRGLAAY